MEEELQRTSYHASANVDLHVYIQQLESESRDLRYQITMREKEKYELNKIIEDFEVQVNIYMVFTREINEKRKYYSIKTD